jgi:hypothetical protein
MFSNNRNLLICLLITFILLSLSSFDCLFCEKITSTKTDSSEISVTIYNGGYGIVKEKRNIDLKSGDIELLYIDVASKIDPTSVHFKSITSPDKVRILEQNYEYDLINPNKLLEKYVGKKVRLLTTTPEGKELWKDAELMSINEGNVFKIDNEIYLFRNDQIILPDIPENLVAKPTLVWQINSKQEGKNEVEVSYMTDGITWKADYVAVIDKDDKSLDLDGWVTIDNKSGGEYQNSNLKLVAGDVHRETEQPKMEYMRAPKVDMAMGEAAPQFEQRDLFEYKIYQLNRKTTIKDNQTKQMMLLSGSNIKADKIFMIKDDQYYHYQYNGEKKIKAKVMMEFVNSAENNLGLPIPKGKVRAFKRDVDGSVEFIGEDSVDHTPKDEKITILLGNAFDIVAEKKQTDYKNMGSSSYEASYEITIRNHKAEDVVVKVVESIYGDWRVYNNNIDFVKKSSDTIEFTVPVAKDGTAVVKYTCFVS